MLDPVESWTAHCKTLRLDPPPPDHEPLPSFTRRACIIEDDGNGNLIVEEFCHRSGNVVDRLIMSANDKGARDDVRAA